jgi:hypothetical protein
MGKFSDLPVTPFKFTLGIIKRKVPDRPYIFYLPGKDSTATEELNGLIALSSEFYSHQSSDRDMPKTNFASAGIQQGKQTAKEYTGVMLLIATVLFSNKGHEILTSGRWMPIRRRCFGRK